MLQVTVKLDPPLPVWPDLKESDLVEIDPETPIEVAYLSGVMASGAPGVAIKVMTPDGKAVIIQTSVKIFLTAAAGIKGRAERDGLTGYADLTPPPGL